MMSHVRIMAGIRDDVKVPAGNDRQEITFCLARTVFKALWEDDPSLEERRGFRVHLVLFQMPDPAQHPPEEWKRVVERLGATKETRTGAI